MSGNYSDKYMKGFHEDAKFLQVNCSGSYDYKTDYSEKVICEFCKSSFWLSKENIRCQSCGASYYDKPN